MWANCSFEQTLYVNQFTKNELFVKCNSLYDPVVEEDSNFGLFNTQSFRKLFAACHNYMMLLFLFFFEGWKLQSLFIAAAWKSTISTFLKMFLILCSTEESKSHGFGTIFGTVCKWFRIFIFGWTIPFHLSASSCILSVMFLSISFSFIVIFSLSLWLSSL